MRNKCYCLSVYAIVLALPVFLTPVVSAQNDSTTPGVQLETLHGIQLQGQQLSWDVVTTGCTDISDFQVRLRQESENTLLGIYRINPDRCRRRPAMLNLAVDLPPDIKRILLENPLVIQNACSDVKATVGCSTGTGH